MNYSRGVQRGETGGSGGDGGGDGRRKKETERRKEDSPRNDTVIHPTLCRELRLKDAKVEARRLPRVRQRSSNRVNNCFTLTHTLVLLEAKSRLPAAAAVVTHFAGRGGRENCCKVGEVWHAWRLGGVVIYRKRTGGLS